LLEEERRLNLDDPVDYPQTYPAGPRARPTTPDQIIAEWGRHSLLFEPGTRFRYSNLNYVIAGRIAEKVAGEPLFAILRRKVFTPLGMKAVLDLDEIDPQTPNVAIGYVRHALGELQPAPQEGRGWSFGAGQVLMTASDLARWDEALLSDRLLAAKQAQEEVSAPKLADGSQSPYALGLFVSKQGGRTVLYHVGQGLGFLGVNRIYPQEHTAFIVLTNDSSSLAFAHIAQRLAYLVLPSTPADAQARTVFKAIQANDFDRQQASPDFNTYFDARMAREYADSLGPLGEPDSFELRSEDQADGLTTRTYEVDARGHHLRVIEQVLADGRIESFQVQSAQ
jgi:D-alanyl-D-alanine carboxypeptidase